jgi:hypothetical protein
MVSLVYDSAQRLAPPRVLHCEFPLGRPLGKPRDSAFQRGVLDAAFGLLGAPSGPVLEVYPDQIEDEADAPLSCQVPPPHDTGRSPVAEEVLAYRPAYNRGRERIGRTLVGRAINPEGVPDAVDELQRILDGAPWQRANLPGSVTDVAMDVRAYFEEAAVALSGHIPAARAADSWFFRTTSTGRLLLAVQGMLRDQGEPRDLWFGIAPAGYG